MTSDKDDCASTGDYREWRRQRELELDDDVYGVPAPEPPPVIEPCRTTKPLTTPANLGSHFAGRARAAGCEDAYDNEIEARYGKGW